MKKTPISQYFLPKPSFQTMQGLAEVYFLLVFAIALFLLVSLLSYHPQDPSWTLEMSEATTIQNMGGVVGAWMSDVLINLLGFMAYFVPVALVLMGMFIFPNDAFRGWMAKFGHNVVAIRVFGFVLVILASCGLAELHFAANYETMPVGLGGIVGDVVATGLVDLFSLQGATLFMLVFWMVGVSLITDLSWLRTLESAGRFCRLCYLSLEGFVKAIKAGHLKTHQWWPQKGFQKLLDGSWRNQSSESQTHIQFDAPVDVLDETGVADIKSDYAKIFETEAPQVETQIPMDEKETPDSFEPSISIEEPLNDNEELFEIDGLNHVETEAERVSKQVAAVDVEGIPSFVIHNNESSMESQEASDSSTEFERKTPAPDFSKHIKDPNLKGVLPSLDLLVPPKAQTSGYSKARLDELSELIVSKLKEFRVEVEVVDVQPGPVITRFELMPAPGVKASKISGLASDLARSLSMTAVRVVEVIPGKPTIGVEIPNENRATIFLREVLADASFANSDKPLTMGLGKDIAATPVSADLAKMPHLLVAGTTGSGKSVGVNTMLVSMLYKCSPEALRLILIDPKMLELSVYNDIPHLLAPVVTDMNEAANSLRWCVGEMERRYKLMSQLGVRNIIGYNEKIDKANSEGKPISDPLYTPPEIIDPDGDPPEIPTLDKMPYIVIIIDEFADMIMVVGKKVEELIARLAQKARAAGIHLILATQRPSVDVITGLIKANVPSRIAFQVSSKIDSRTILDQMGAENLLGMGDMMYLPPGTSIPMRVHGAFVSDDEVHAVVEFLKSTGEPEYVPSLTEEQTEILMPGEKPQNADSNDLDPLYDEAVAIVCESQKASISYLQRRLKVGYNRAARMIEDMEQQEIVGPLQSNGSREILAGGH